MVGDRQLREGQQSRNPQASPEESDAGMVPKKPAKTRVTPVESVEGRAAAEGKSAHETRPGTGPGKRAHASWSGSDSERRRRQGGAVHQPDERAQGAAA